MRVFESREKILGFDDREVFLKGVPIISVLVSLLLFSELLVNKNFVLFFISFLVTIIIVIIYWLSLREVHYFYIKKYPSYSDDKKRVWMTLTFMTIVFILVYNGVHWIFNFTVLILLPDFFFPIPVIELVASILFCILSYFLYESIYANFRLRRTLMEKESLEKANIISQLMGLRSQINPHFLFNSLNTLSALISKDSDRAEDFVAKLSKVYRYILEQKDEDLTTVEQELKWLNSYVYLLEERFGNKLIVYIDIKTEHKGYFVLPLCLQIIFENAIKYNVIASDRPLSIHVYSDGNSLCVSNNLQKKNNVLGESNLGLKNLSERSRFFIEKEIEIQETETSFKVYLPMIKPIN